MNNFKISILMELYGAGEKGLSAKQLADRLSAEKRFIFFHLITPMRTKNEQSNYITASPVVKWEKEKALRGVFEANLADSITRWEHNKIASEVS